jgi:2-amino-4-hydroxy-6-hydroxymethyldihydropteridine diphosphokinase
MVYDWQMKSQSVKPPQAIGQSELDQAIVVGLGSNLTGPWESSVALLEAAIARLQENGLLLLLRSSWWQSKAWPDPGDPPFTNGVALFCPGASPVEILATLMGAEQAFGRTRNDRNGPRSLDLDLIAHGRMVLRTSDLVLPHPRAQERLFVTGPLAEVAPTWRHPVSGLTALELTGRATIGLDARPLGRAALHKRGRNAI